MVCTIIIPAITIRPAMLPERNNISVAGVHQPVFELTRGNIVESIHFGSVAVVDSNGRLLAWYGDPTLVTFMRSSAKPFQALPFIEHGGDQTFHLTSKEIAIICASHEGTDEHVEVIKGIQTKVGVSESDLLCGTHLLSHLPTVEAMRARGTGDRDMYDIEGALERQLALVATDRPTVVFTEALDPRVLEAVCREILQEFFRERRQKP